MNHVEIPNHKKVTANIIDPENERVRVFNQKRLIETPSFKFEGAYDQEKGQIFLKHVNGDIPDSTLDMSTKVLSSLCTGLGTSNHEYLHLALDQTVNAQFVRKENGINKANATVEALISMAPQDIIEGQLCSRLVILQDHYNEHMRRAALPNQPLEIIERYINSATKLMRLYNDTLDALNKHRRKGEQKVTVQHVNISGGQAVVAGEFNQARGRDAQKEERVPHVS